MFLWRSQERTYYLFKKFFKKVVFLRGGKMKNVMFLAVFLIAVAASGCLMDMNDDYDKSAGGSGSYTVTGTFTDNSGNAIAGLTVVLSGEEDVTAVTDADGVYVFENVEVGAYTIKPGSSGHGAMNLVVSGATDVGTNSSGHGEKDGTDYTCSGCHK